MRDPVAVAALGIPGVVWLWIAALLAFSLFGARVWRYVGILRRARPENRLDRPLKRVLLFAQNVLLQSKFVKEGAIGPAHLALFWAFLVYAGCFGWNLVRGLLPFLPVPYAEEIPYVGGVLAVVGVAGLVALAIAAGRRYLFRPPRLEVSTDGAVILVLIALVLATYLGQFGTRTESVRTGLWWAHMLIVLSFLAYLPFSKHLHLLAAPFSVFFTTLDQVSLPPPSEGARRLDEFTWRQLFSGLACAECGRCDRHCPAFQAGYPLSPKELMETVRHGVRSNSAELAMPAEALWSCTSCGSCKERCLCFNEHLPLIVEMRRRLVADGGVEAGLQEALTRLTRYGNSFGLPARSRPKWTQGLSFAVPDARKEAVDVLWFTGDYSAYDPRLQPATRAAARLLEAAGIRFGILAEAEQNSGADVRRAGEEGLFELLEEKNRAALARAGYQRIVTADPHSYQALRHEYRWENGNGHRPVLHIAELFDELLASGRLAVRRPLTLRATYHDPCYLGRYNGIYDAPRRVLKAIGVDLTEMPRHHDRSFCCGAGGGRIWMEDPPEIKERPAEMRVREAASVPGVEVLATACPKDYIMFQDAVKTTGLEGRLQVKDLAELLEDATLAGKETSAHAT